MTTAKACIVTLASLRWWRVWATSKAISGPARIQQNGIDRQAHVFIDPQGVVQRIMFTDEPRLDDDRGR